MTQRTQNTSTTSTGFRGQTASPNNTIQAKEPVEQLCHLPLCFSPEVGRLCRSSTWQGPHLPKVSRGLAQRSRLRVCACVCVCVRIALSSHVCRMASYSSSKKAFRSSKAFRLDGAGVSCSNCLIFSAMDRCFGDIVSLTSTTSRRRPSSVQAVM